MADQNLNFHPFSALRFRDFRLLYTGLLISRIGSEMQVVAVSWQIYILSGNPLSLGLIGLSRFLPVVLFSLIGGIAADRFDRRKVMMVSQIVMTCLSLMLAFTTRSGTITALFIYIMVAANSLAGVFDTPARQSVVPLLVPKKEFVNAVSLSSAIWNMAVVLGPSISGFIIAGIGIDKVYFINAFTFLISIITLLMMKKINKETSTISSLSLSALTEGLRFVFKTPLIYSSMLLDFFATFFSSATVLLPVFAKDILMVGPQGLGILYAAPSLGAITGGLFVSTFPNIKNQGKLLIGSVFFYGAATFLFGFSRNFTVSLIFLYLTGLGDVISSIIRNTIRQLNTPDHLRGRMVAVNMVFFYGGPQLGEAEAGLLAALIGAPLSVAVGGVGTIVVTAVVAYLVPALRKYRRNDVIMS